MDIGIFSIPGLDSAGLTASSVGLPVGGRGTLGILSMGKFCILGISGLESAGIFNRSGMSISGLFTSSPLAMKVSISEIMVDPGLWGMSGICIVGLPTVNMVGRGRFVVDEKKLGPSSTGAPFVGLDISIKEILGLCGFALGPDITGLLFVTTGLGLLF